MEKKYIIGGLAVVGAIALLAYLRPKHKMNSEEFFNAYGKNFNELNLQLNIFKNQYEELAKSFTERLLSKRPLTLNEFFTLNENLGSAQQKYMYALIRTKFPKISDTNYYYTSLPFIYKYYDIRYPSNGLGTLSSNVNLNSNKLRMIGSINHLSNYFNTFADNGKILTQSYPASTYLNF
jgi:hypothetical protein